MEVFFFFLCGQNKVNICVFLFLVDFLKFDPEPGCRCQSVRRRCVIF